MIYLVRYELLHLPFPLKGMVEEASWPEENAFLLYLYMLQL